MTPTKAKLGDKLWATLKPKCEAAAAYSASSIKEWAKIASETVNGNEHADWRWLLADLRERCFNNDIECPYTVTYLIQLAETYQKVEGNFDREVVPSVLVEGRNLDNLLDIIEPGMTVGRMKAIVKKELDSQETRSVDEIEAEQTRHRLDGREKAKRKKHHEKIANWPLDKSDDLLSNLKEESAAYQSAIVRIQAEGAEFSPGDIAVALAVAKGLVSTLEEIAPVAVVT